MNPWITILGGSQSGKTDFAHAICAPFDDVVWWGTGSSQLEDPEWQSRLESLRAARKGSWHTLDGPLIGPNSFAALSAGVPPDHRKAKVFVLDSLNLWLAALLNESTARYSMSQAKVHLELEFQQLLKSLRALPCAVLVVSAEVGSGVVPAGEAGRLFRDLLCAWNRSIVQFSRHGISMQAGRALLWPGGQTQLPPDGAPVLCVDEVYVRRLLCPV